MFMTAVMHLCPCL